MLNTKSHSRSAIVSVPPNRLVMILENRRLRGV